MNKFNVSFTFTNTILSISRKGNRYRVDIFSVNLFFNGLSNDISHLVVA